jgi:hypothetical protein
MKCAARPRNTRALRLYCLELAATGGHFDHPKDTVARAENYLNFVIRGPAPKPKPKTPARRPTRWR